jgi:hypothetical protein
MMLTARTQHWTTRELPAPGARYIVPPLTSAFVETGIEQQVSYASMAWFLRVLYFPALFPNVPCVSTTTQDELEKAAVSFQFPTAIVGVDPEGEAFQWNESFMAVARFFECSFVLDRCESVLKNALLARSRSHPRDDLYQCAWEMLVLAIKFNMPDLRESALSELSLDRRALTGWLLTRQHFTLAQVNQSVRRSNTPSVVHTATPSHIKPFPHSA